MPMTFSLLSLPDEIISFHLVKFLDASDIIQLFLTCKQLYQTLNSPVVWHLLYVKSFSDLSDDEYSFDTFYRWGPNLYKMRKNSQLLTFGSNVFGRLGSSDTSSANYERIHFVKRLYKPIVIDSIHSMADLSAGGFSFEVLTTGGDLYYTGRNWRGALMFGSPGPEQRDEGLPTTGSSSAVTKVTAGDSTGRLISVSSGRGHFIALDKDGKLWTWDSPYQGKIGIPLRLVDAITGQPIRGRILKIRAGWTTSTCLVEKVGIVIWRRRDHVRGWRDGLPVQGHVDAFVSVVPNTTEDVISDYVVLEDAIVYLSKKGRIYRVDIAGHGVGRPLIRFEQYAKSHGDTKFIRISGFFKTFTVITNGDQVLIGKSDEEWPMVIPELQQRSVIAVVAGDYHFLALTREGKMYSWGRESRANGCLGLGKLEEVVREGKGHMEGGDLVVDKPTMVDVGGVVLAIAAGGWQSAALRASY
ncbi:DEKNAAC101225 [Brettanomyces naardenensis]|uniref:DEKNAAC101225 n=1 Tax=Brettanomyces naardenensis TaxID=13370 RepID=A0A448YHQ6_BRENA|nr:DEKNAAC101225 [Brettanomyces naardenensis]